MPNDEIVPTDPPSKGPKTYAPSNVARSLLYAKLIACGCKGNAHGVKAFETAEGMVLGAKAGQTKLGTALMVIDDLISARLFSMSDKELLPLMCEAMRNSNEKAKGFGPASPPVGAPFSAWPPFLQGQYMQMAKGVLALLNDLPKLGE